MEGDKKLALRSEDPKIAKVRIFKRQSLVWSWFLISWIKNSSNFSGFKCFESYLKPERIYDDNSSFFSLIISRTKGRIAVFIIPSSKYGKTLTIELAKANLTSSFWLLYNFYIIGRINN